MRELADGFSAEHFYKGRTWNKLRLLTKPFARYGKPGTDVQDGALFCFAHGTNPEVLLTLESRPGKDGLEWQYAFADDDLRYKQLLERQEGLEPATAIQRRGRRLDQYLSPAWNLNPR